MSSADRTLFQPSLFSTVEPTSIDDAFAGMKRIQLDDASWVDWLPGWVRGADGALDEIVRTRAWKQRTRWMYERRMLEPRLTALWLAGSGEPLTPAVVEEMRRALSERYGVNFDSVGFNLYRDGQDSVAWHGDKISREIAEPIVALVSLGAPRKFLLRPKGGGRSMPFQFRSGDLLVTGGKTQRTWEHSIPKVAKAEPRISLAFRYGMQLSAYGETDR